MNKYILMQQAWMLYLRLIAKTDRPDLLSLEAIRLRRIEKRAGARYDRRAQAYQAE